MNLLQIRQQFLQVSGRHDLVGVRGENTGADFYINAGQRMLDRMVDLLELRKVALVQLPVGYYKVVVDDVRVVREVWVFDTQYRAKLERAPLDQLLATYKRSNDSRNTTLQPNLNPQADSFHRGTPMYYSVGAFKVADRQQDLLKEYNFRNIIGAEDKVYGNDYTGMTLVILPAPSTEVTVQVNGLFYSPALKSDGDTTFWTQSAPDALLQAAMFQLETHYRNTEGAKDWMNSLQVSVQGLDFDQADQDSVGIDCLGG